MRPVQPVPVVDQPTLGVIILVLAVAAVLSWRNLRAGRGDIRGAGRLAVLAFGVEMLKWVCTAHHVSTLDELNLFLGGGISWAVFIAGLLWTLYVALEPYVRRYWPQSIISWSRLLSGGIRDPLVGGQLLAGIAVGVSAALLSLVQQLLLAHYDSPSLDSVLDARRMMGESLSLLIGPLGFAMGCFLLLFLLRVLLRRQWLAVAALILLLVTQTALGSDHKVIDASFAAIAGGLVIFTMIRFGVLAFVIYPLVTGALASFPLTTDFSTWYAGSTIFALAVVLALTAYAFRTAVAGRPLFKTQ
jgi:uncharacterized membrane protein (DUF441 family)